MKYFVKEITSACILEVMAGTNCPMGGDSGHGGQTEIMLRDLGGTDMRVFVKDSDGKKHHFNDIDSVELFFGGDCECENLIEALEFALDKIKKIYNANRKQDNQ